MTGFTLRTKGNGYKGEEIWERFMYTYHRSGPAPDCVELAFRACILVQMRNLACTWILYGGFQLGMHKTTDG